MEFDLICLSDNKMICQHCALFGDHKNHNFRKIEDYCKEVNLELNQLVKSMDKTDKDIFIIDEYDKEIFNKVEFKKKKKIGEIKKKFNSLREVLDSKENFMVRNVGEEFDFIFQNKISFLTENKNIKLKKEKILKKIKKIKKYLETNKIISNLSKIFKKTSFINSFKKIKKTILCLKKEKKNLEKIINEKKFIFDNTEILEILKKNIFLNNEKNIKKNLEIKTESIRSLEDINNIKNSILLSKKIYQNLSEEEDDYLIDSSSDLTKDLVFELQEPTNKKKLTIDLSEIKIEKQFHSRDPKIQKRQSSFTKSKTNHLSTSQKVMRPNHFQIKNNVNIFNNNFPVQVMSPRIQKISNHYKRFSGSFSTKNSRNLNHLKRFKSNFGEEQFFGKNGNIFVNEDNLLLDSNFVEKNEIEAQGNNLFYQKNHENENKEVLKQNNFLNYNNKKKNTRHYKHNSVFKLNKKNSNELLKYNKMLENSEKPQYNIKNHFKTSKNQSLKNENNFFISKKNKKRKNTNYERLNTNLNCEKNKIDLKKEEKKKKKKEVAYDNLRITDSKLNHLLKLILSEGNAISLNLNKNLITTNGFQKLLNQIITKNFEKLYLKNNKIDSKALKIILTYADSMTSLKYINLENNEIQNSCSKKYKKLLKNKGITLVI